MCKNKEKLQFGPIITLINLKSLVFSLECSPTEEKLQKRTIKDT